MQKYYNIFDGFFQVEQKNMVKIAPKGSKIKSLQKINKIFLKKLAKYFIVCYNCVANPLLRVKYYFWRAEYVA